MRRTRLTSYPAGKLMGGNVVRIRDNQPIDEDPGMSLKDVHDHLAIEQVKVIQAHDELRVPRRQVTHLRFSGEPGLYVDRLAGHDTGVAYQPEAVVPVGEHFLDHRLQIADECVLREVTVGKVPFLFREELQNVVSLHELAGNPVQHRRRRVDEADTLVARAQTSRNEVRDDIVHGGAAAAIEGADVVTFLESEIRDVRSSRDHGSPPRLKRQSTFADSASRGVELPK